MNTDKKQIIDETIEYIREIFSGNSGGHDYQHSMRVYRNALAILDASDKEEIEISDEADSESSCDIHGLEVSKADDFIVVMAALLHDADDHKLFDTTDNANARTFLNEKGVEADVIDKICDAINSVSFSQNRGRRPDTIEGCIVQDADRLDAMGAVGVARTFAYGGEHGRSLEESMQHFYDKLLLLKNEINTDAARQIAEERHDFLQRFLDELKKELS